MKFQYDIPTQVRFVDDYEAPELDEERWTGGIAYNDFVICGECGSIVPCEDVRKIEEYSEWVSISNEIMGC